MVRMPGVGSRDPVRIVHVTSKLQRCNLVFTCMLLITSVSWSRLFEQFVGVSSLFQSYFLYNLCLTHLLQV